MGLRTTFLGSICRPLLVLLSGSWRFAESYKEITGGWGKSANIFLLQTSLYKYFISCTFVVNFQYALISTLIQYIARLSYSSLVWSSAPVTAHEFCMFSQFPTLQNMPVDCDSKFLLGGKGYVMPYDGRGVTSRVYPYLAPSTPEIWIHLDSDQEKAVTLVSTSREQWPSFSD